MTLFKCTFALSALISALYAQPEFEFSLYLEDAAGNKDTLVFGYDDRATDSIDTEFDEEDIAFLPFDTTLDARISWNNLFRGRTGEPVPFQSKRQITNIGSCDAGTPTHMIEILTRHWPIKIHWDSTKFIGPCLSTSFLFGQVPDIAGSSSLQVLYLRSASQFEVTKQLLSSGYAHVITRENGSTDTVSQFWHSFSDKALDDVVAIVEWNHNKNERGSTKLMRERKYFFYKNLDYFINGKKAM